jgi:hypothetical protein
MNASITSTFNLTSIFDDIGAMPADHPVHPGFDYRAIVPVDIAPRDPSLSWALHHGLDDLNALFDHGRVRREHILLVFPERHLTPSERQEMIYAFTQADGLLRRLDVVTADTMILTDFTQDRIRLLRSGRTG